MAFLKLRRVEAAPYRSVRASRRSDFSCCQARALNCVGLSSCDSHGLEQGLCGCSSLA